MPEALLDSALPTRLDWFGVWLLGLSMGLTACTVTCLPYLGSWVLGRGAGPRAALYDTGAFLLGRISAYTLLGALAGAFSGWLARALEGHTGQLLIATASIASGLWLLWPKQAAHASCTLTRRGAGAAPFALGFSLSLAPCAPLAALLAACALSGEAVAGASYGAWFGLGAAVTPLVLIVPLVGLSGRRLIAAHPALLRALRIAAAVALLALGLRRLLLFA
jgi:sulfite exporter TauE/SafE